MFFCCRQPTLQMRVYSRKPSWEQLVSLSNSLAGASAPHSVCCFNEQMARESFFSTKYIEMSYLSTCIYDYICRTLYNLIRMHVRTYLHTLHCIALHRIAWHDMTWHDMNTYIHTYRPTDRLTDRPYLPTYPHTHIPTYPHTYMPTYLPTYLDTYIDT